MARYSRVFTQFWTDEKVLQMTEDERVLALYLLSCPHGNMLGVFVLPRAYGFSDLGWTPGRYDEALQGLLRCGFIQCDQSVNLLWIPNHLRHNPVENDSQAKAAAKVVGELPRSPFLADLAARVRESGKAYLEDLAEALEARCPARCPAPCQPQCAAPSPAPVTVSDTETETAAAPDSERRPGGCARPVRTVEYTPEFEEFWQQYPRHEDKRVAFRVWKSRLKEGARPLDMTEAAANYAAACRAQRRTSDKCKMASTFLGPDEPFKEWINRAPETAKPVTGEPKSWAAIRRVMEQEEALGDTR